MEAISEEIKVIKVGDVETFGTFEKRVLVGELVGESKYPDYRAIEWTKDRMAKLDAVRVGQVVTVKYLVKGRMSKDGRVFVSLFGLSISTPANATPAGTNDSPCDMTGYGSEAARIPDPAELVNEPLPF